jgi:hypothetical protein
MPLGFDLFSSVRIQSVMQGLLDPRLLPAQFVFSKRIPTVKALDADITARFIGYPQIADLIADDSRAAVYSTGKFQLESTKIPNLKIGANMKQSMLAQILNIGSNTAFKDSLGFFSDWESRTLFNQKLGLQQRIEVLLSAMLQDSFVYDRLGMKISASWGMPSDLKPVVGTAWDNIAATPVTDLLTLKRLAQVKYGVTFKRLTMSLAALNFMTATTEFQNRAKAFIPIGFTLPSQYALQNTDAMMALAQKIIGLDIELYDQRYWSQDEAGVPSSFPYWPITKVLMDDPANDGNSEVMDFANAVVIESMVSALAGEPIAGAQSPGPLSYATYPENLNPPEITYWAVQRGFPRKHLLQANACLTVGSFVDPISATVPF